MRQSPTDQIHIYQRVEDLYTRAGGRMRPEEKAAVEKARVAVEDLCQEFKQVRETNNADGLWDCYNRLKQVAQKLREKVEEMRQKYA